MAGARRVQPPHVERYMRSPAEREAIEVVAIDSYDAYRQAVKTALPGARIGCDPFHQPLLVDRF